jgi:putative ABC transport system permease protein
MIDWLLRDATIGARMLRRNLGSTAVSVITIALGIGVSTALFSVVYGVWLHAYPYDRIDEIIYPRARATNARFADSQNGVFRQHEFLEFGRVSAVEDAMANSLYDDVTLQSDSGPQLVASIGMSSHAFQFLGVRPVLGRTLEPADFRANGDVEPVVVLSFLLWRRAFNGAPDVVGHSVLLDGVPHVIVGVMPARFGWGSASLPTNDGLYVPLPRTRSGARLRVWIRLRRGVTRVVAAQQFHVLFEDLAKRQGSLPKSEFGVDFREFSAGTGDTARYVTQMRAALRLLLYAVGFLLLIASTNVANLQLARSSVRAREIAIRLAVGASRWNVFRQLLTENVLLAVVGGTAGLGLAVVLTRIIAALIPRGYVPSESIIATNLPVLVVGLTLSMASGVLFGLAPAIQGARTELNQTMKETGTGAGGRQGARLRNALIVVEIALALVLLTGAALAIRGYLAIPRPDWGFNPDHLVVAEVQWANLATDAAAQAARESALVRDLPSRVRDIPNVTSVTTTSASLFVSRYRIANGEPRETPGIGVMAVGPEYVRTMEARLIAGRDLSRTEVTQGEAVALASSDTSTIWPEGRGLLGAHMSIELMNTRPGTPNSPMASPSMAGGVATAAAANPTHIEVTVVGVLAARRDVSSPPLLIVPNSIRGLPRSSHLLLVRTRAADPLQPIDSIRKAIFALDPNAMLAKPLDYGAATSDGLLQPRFNIALFGGLAVIALGLAAAGVFALLSYQVARQRREIGIRVALGASGQRIVRMVVGHGAVLLGWGLLIGVGGSALFGRVAKSQVTSIPAVDVSALAISAAILAAIGLVACYLPATRAKRVDPLTVLRAE